MLTLLLSAALAQPPVEATWDLTPLYPDDAAWEADFAKAEAEIGDLVACRGTLAQKGALVRCFETQSDVAQRIARIGTYANCASAVDVGDDALRGRAQRVSGLWSRYGEALAWFEPEVLAVGEAKVTKILDKDKGSPPWRYPVRKILREGAHTLDPDREALLAAAQPVMGSGFEVFDVLSNAELPYPTLTLSDGTEVRVDGAGYGKYRASTVPEDRKAVMDAWLQTHADFEGTLGATLNAQLRANWFGARARGYGSTLEAATAADAVPVEVYDTLIAQVNESLPTLHRYLQLRKRMLGLETLTYADLYPPLVQPAEATYPLERGKELTIQATASLGPKYTEALKTGFEGRWMDVYPRKGKDGGGWMNGSVYAVHPYILLNYSDDWDSVSVLAHEWGHAVHTVLANEAQPAHLADYATFAAEVPSTFNQAMLLRVVLSEAKTDDERLFYLGNHLENLRTTFYRQALFAEFERASYRQIEADTPMTGADFTALYLDLLRRYYGHDQGVTVIDDLHGAEWSMIPHFYWNYYVYQYATSLAAGSLFATEVHEGREGAVERYLDFQRSGGSDDPTVLLARAGVDMTTPAPYQALVAEMNRVMDDIEAILAKAE